MNEETYEQRKKKIYDFMCDSVYVPMKIKELAVVLGVKKEERQGLEQMLAELVEEGRIQLSRRGKYAKAEVTKQSGIFCAHPRGFGFVTVEGEAADIFIPEARTGGAMHLDRVEIVVSPLVTGKRREGAVVRIVERGIKRVVGTFEERRSFGFVVPDNAKLAQDIFVPKEQSLGAVNGHRVVAEITDYGQQKGRMRNPEGKIVEILGHANDPGVDILSLVRAYELPVEFSEKIYRQVERVAKPVSSADMQGRTDLRDWQMVTIDGEDAKDLDDAVSLFREGENYLLGVHIADVTNYVQEHSALDEEAKKRGTSVYLVDRVIPMLPHALSNGICSLNQGEDRLALSCIMTVSPGGDVIDHRIEETVIRVDRRMTYTNVKKILADRDKTVREEYAPFVPMFERMEELAGILRAKRKKRGSIDFDFPETKVILDDQGRAADIKPYERNVATDIIEDFMLIANETVAADYYWQELPFVYRTHEKPDDEKIKRLAALIGSFGYTLHLGTQKGAEVHPKELQKLLAKIDGAGEEALISRLTLRSMKRARYTVENTGHFGLAADCYTHFTSPIRRYPDLQIHRIIKENIRGRLGEERRDHYARILPEVCRTSSETERRAEEAERETVKLKKTEYMQAHIGENFTGVISGVTEWGFFVELSNTVEGLVRVTALDDDYYRFYPDTFELAGEATNRRFRLGQKVEVFVESVDVLTRTINFELA